ncbi:MAG: bifunctional DNA primase/polymerase [Desulfovibrio sp.]|nr:bifunctional DNA primase/polymerase [Desulfovibrio sp.]
MDINDIKKLIDDNYDSYPNMAWLETVIKYFSNYFSLIPLNQGVYKGNTDDEVKSERMIEDLKGTKVSGWEKYSYEKSPYIPTGDKYGIVCGPGTNNNGILVLDVDNIEDFKKFCHLYNINMMMPTLTILTRPDKYHLYFKYPNDGKEYKSRTKGKENCGFDVRGVGGYVLGPGSINPISKKPYTIFDILPIADCPEWLKEWSLNRTINNQQLEEYQI